MNYSPSIIALLLGGGFLWAMSQKKRKRRTIEIPKEEAQKLTELGYDISSDTVKFFQEDFNTVQDAYHLWERRLEVTGSIDWAETNGAETIKALDQALELSAQQNDPWRWIVASADAGVPL